MRPTESRVKRSRPPGVAGFQGEHKRGGRDPSDRKSLHKAEEGEQGQRDRPGSLIRRDCRNKHRGESHQKEGNLA